MPGNAITVALLVGFGLMVLGGYLEDAPADECVNVKLIGTKGARCVQPYQARYLGAVGLAEIVR